MFRFSKFTLALATLIACNKGDGTDSDAQDSAGDTAAGVTQDDRDGDTILDVQEGESDADGDGEANADDKDSDGDSINDKTEAGDADPLTLPIDSDSDGMEDFLDTDSDNNCLGDRDEKGDTTPVDTDGDGTADYADPDNDGDSILDEEEIGDISACSPADSDGDEVPDYMDEDSDNDGVGDLFEAGNTEFDPDPTDTDGDGTPDYLDSDSDNDGTPDGAESGVSSPDDEPSDTDGDGLYDFQDTDADGDGLSDEDERETYKTDPFDFDSDGDGYSDGGEVLAGTDPLDEDDVIDGIYVEVTERTEVEQDFNFALAIQRGDIAVLTDTTGSMGGTITAVQSAYTTMLSDLQATFEDVAGGAAEFDDYAYGSYGSTPDNPFILAVGMTTDFAAVQSGVSGWFASGGGDGPEGSMEALYQSASGAGYDQDCDGSYDATDVLPFIASSTDPFNGGAGEHYDPSLPDAGTRGGFGFREYSLPIIIAATDNYMRDPESTNGTYNGSPGGCPIDAGHSDVVAAFADLGAYFIGVDTSTLPWPQMITLAQDTESLIDSDGDGEKDTELVTYLDQNSSTFASDFSDFVLQAVEQLVSEIKFSSVTLEIEGDEYGFVTDINPESYTDIDPESAEDLVFTLTFRGTVAATVEDQIFLLTLNVIGDGTTLVGTKDIIVVVPGTSY